MALLAMQLFANRYPSIFNMDCIKLRHIRDMDIGRIILEVIKQMFKYSVFEVTPLGGDQGTC